MPVEETRRAFDDFIRQGKVRSAGCFNHAAWHVMKAVAVSQWEGLARYISPQVSYWLIGRDIEHEIVPLGVDQAVGVMACSPLHAGLLTGKFQRDVRPEVSRLNDLDAPGTIDYERVYRIVDVLAAVVREREVTPAQVAVNWVLSEPGVDTCCTRRSGATTWPPRHGG